ncbi:MAG: nucleotidyltransferase family protein [Acidobacteriota bacterium]|nr:nucleotidyltransferase family protein [Acidobacteriota bacterium]
MPSDSIGIILLAAGASVRLGAAKQLLEFQNQTLLRRSAEIAVQISVAVVVTLGARSELLRREIEDLPLAVVENEDWKQGMGGSAKIGLKKLLETNAELRGVIIMVCDQPFVSVDLLEKIIAEFDEMNAPIIACQYASTLGVPALFAAELFPELLALKPAHGAKHLIKKHLSKTVAVPFPEGAFDIDTAADYEKLLKNFA